MEHPSLGLPPSLTSSGRSGYLGMSKWPPQVWVTSNWVSRLGSSSSLFPRTSGNQPQSQVCLLCFEKKLLLWYCLLQHRSVQNLGLSAQLYGYSYSRKMGVSDKTQTSVLGAILMYKYSMWKKQALSLPSMHSWQGYKKNVWFFFAAALTYHQSKAIKTPVS